MSLPEQEPENEITPAAGTTGAFALTSGPGVTPDGWTGRSVARGRSECKHGHPMTEENTYSYRDGRRECRTCNRERAKHRRETKKDRYDKAQERYRQTHRQQLAEKSARERAAAAADPPPMKPKRTYNVNIGIESYRQYRLRIHGGKLPVTTVPWTDPVPDLHDPWGEDKPIGRQS